MTRLEKVIESYAHDFRDMKMSQYDLASMLNGFVETLDCEHQCTSECRRSGCNCDCGEYHIQ